MGDNVSYAIVLNTTKLKIANDGNTLCTLQLQRAIDRVCNNGGGRLDVTPGKYLTGSIMLKSGVELHLMSGAVILGSTNPKDYYSIKAQPIADKRNDNSNIALVLAYNAENISVTGNGTIDGQGLMLALNIDSLYHKGMLKDNNYNVRRMRPSEQVRPKLFYFYKSNNVTVSDLCLKNSACWGLSFDLCVNLNLKNLNITNCAYWNNDGIDIDDCQHVKIADCDINSADDAICLKSYHANSSCVDVDVQRCNLRSSASGVKFGTASWGGFSNIHVADIKVFDTFRSAIAIESVDGGSIDSVCVERINAVNTGNAIFLRLGQRAGSKNGSMKNIILRDITCTVPFERPDKNYDLRGPEVDFFHNPFPSSICGIPGNKIQNVMLENINIVYPGRATKGMAYVPLWRADKIDEQIMSYPEFSMFGELPSWGFYVRHVSGITFSNVKLSLADNDFRPAFVFEDAANVTLKDVTFPGDKSRQIYFVDK
ncbi:polygalacturonase [Prevotella herbatica]|uniref:Polygalacturonase n=2 Tax=Prevotella herbatica TaxID=2801997 RepID=A0ABM7NYQ3_9BACT|nr:polygalacturonase [Prevotella herbatica]